MPRIKKDTNQILIETMVQRSLRDIACSPERTIRNLVDLALNFSHGRFQRNFLETAQAMLKNKKSAYYDLLKDAIASIDHFHFRYQYGIQQLYQRRQNHPCH